MKKTISGLIATVLVTSSFALYSQPYSKEVFIRGASKKQYAKKIPELRMLDHFKKAVQLSTGKDFTLTKKTADWDEQVQAIETTLKEITTLRNRYNRPYLQRQDLIKNIDEVEADITKLDRTDVTQFTLLNDEKKSYEAELEKLEEVIQDQFEPELAAKIAVYLRQEKALFALFNEVAREK